MYKDLPSTSTNSIFAIFAAATEFQTNMTYEWMSQNRENRT